MAENNRCPHCRKELPDGLNFCLACGKEVETRPAALLPRRRLKRVFIFVFALLFLLAAAVLIPLLLRENDGVIALPKPLSLTGKPSLPPENGTAELQKTEDPEIPPSVFETAEDGHVHSFTSSTTRPATCSSSGLRTDLCSICGETRTVTLPALPHSFVSTVLTAPTCTEAGTVQKVCSVCGKTETETLPAAGHTWKNASCTEAMTCTVCGQTEGAPLGHSFSGGVCTRCGFSQISLEISEENNRHSSVLSSLSEQYDPQITAAESTARGLASPYGVYTLQSSYTYDALAAEAQTNYQNAAARASYAQRDGDQTTYKTYSSLAESYLQEYQKYLTLKNAALEQEKANSLRSRKEAAAAEENQRHESALAAIRAKYA